MSIPALNNQKGLNNVAHKFTATDGSIHYYFVFAGIWIFVGAGATNESSHAIAGTIPTGSVHINTTTGVWSFYNGSAWKLNTQAS